MEKKDSTKGAMYGLGKFANVEDCETYILDSIVCLPSLP